MDMTKSIEPKSDQMNAEDFISGPQTFTITDIRQGSAEQPVFVYFAEFDSRKPFKPSKTVRRLMVAGWGPDTAAHIGKRMTLYRDPDVRWAGEPIGGIRVSHMSGLTEPLELALSVTRGRRTMYVVLPLADAAPVASMPAYLVPLVEAFDRAQIKGRAERLTFSANVVGRRLSNATELTPDEVGRVVEALDRPGVTPMDARPGPAHLDPGPGREPTDEELALAYEREQEANGNG